jgi:hypothetical protein
MAGAFTPVDCAQWREFKDAKHDLFVQEGEELLLLEGGNVETLLLTMGNEESS